MVRRSALAILLPLAALPSACAHSRLTENEQLTLKHEVRVVRLVIKVRSGELQDIDDELSGKLTRSFKTDISRSVIRAFENAKVRIVADGVDVSGGGGADANATLTVALGGFANCGTYGGSPSCPGARLHGTVTLQYAKLEYSKAFCGEEPLPLRTPFLLPRERAPFDLAFVDARIAEAVRFMVQRIWAPDEQVLADTEDNGTFGNCPRFRWY